MTDAQTIRGFSDLDRITDALDGRYRFCEPSSGRYNMAKLILGPLPSSTSIQQVMQNNYLDYHARFLAMKLWARAVDSPACDGYDVLDYRSMWAIADWSQADDRLAIKTLDLIPITEFDIDEHRKQLDIAWTIRPNVVLQRWLHAKPKNYKPAPANQLELILPSSDDDTA